MASEAPARQRPAEGRDLAESVADVRRREPKPSAVRDTVRVTHLLLRRPTKGGGRPAIQVSGFQVGGETATVMLSRKANARASQRNYPSTAKGRAKDSGACRW